MPEDEILRAEIRRIADDIDGLRGDFKPLRDANIRFAGYVDKLVRSKHTDNANKKLEIEAITQLGYRVGAVESAISNVVARLESAGVVAAANVQVVATKLDRLHDDISGSHPIVDAKSLPPPGSAGMLYEFRKAPRFTQVLIVLVLLLLSAGHLWNLGRAIFGSGESQHQQEPR